MKSGWDGGQRGRAGAVTVGVAAGTLLLMTLAADALLPSLVARTAEQQLAARAQASEARVQIEARPGWRVLSGEASYLHVDLREARFGLLPVNSFLVDAYDLRLDPGRLRRQGEIVLRRHGPVQATLRLTEADLNRYLWATVDKEKAFRLVLGSGTAAAEGSLAVLGQRLPLRIEGRLRVEPPATLRFVPQEFHLAKMRVPRAFLENVVAQVLAVRLPLEDLPLRVRLTEVRVEPGRLFLFANGVSEA
ncbi:MAG TPA: DUF2993 domain-containing protein [Firmicutes bacterium]|nr:DUF2993 domain-containing protein [Bacillota bacterium]